MTNESEFEKSLMSFGLNRLKIISDRVPKIVLLIDSRRSNSWRRGAVSTPSEDHSPVLQWTINCYKIRSWRRMTRDISLLLRFVDKQESFVLRRDVDSEIKENKRNNYNAITFTETFWRSQACEQTRLVSTYTIRRELLVHATIPNNAERDVQNAATLVHQAIKQPLRTFLLNDLLRPRSYPGRAVEILANRHENLVQFSLVLRFLQRVQHRGDKRGLHFRPQIEIANT